MTFKERMKNILAWINFNFSKIPTEIREYASDAVRIVNQIKSGLESDVAAAIVNAIPSTWDNKLRDAAIDILIELAQVLDVIDTSTHAGKIIRGKMLNAMASELTAIRDNRELPTNMYDAAVQLTYTSEGKTK